MKLRDHFDTQIKSGGLVVWRSGHSGGLVVWWSGLHRSAAKRRVAEKLCITKLHRSAAKRRVAEKLCVTKTLYHKNFVSLLKEFLGSTLGNNEFVY